MKPLRHFGICGSLLLILFACAREDTPSNLVQPDKWWKVHPRPIYLQLENTGTFQKWFDVYRLCRDTYAIYEPNQFEEAISYLFWILLSSGAPKICLNILISKFFFLLLLSLCFCGRPRVNKN